MIKQFWVNRKNKLFDRSIGSEHILAIIGVLSINIPLFITISFIWLLRQIKTFSKQPNSLIFSIFLQFIHTIMFILFAIVFGYTSYKLIKLLYNLLKQHRIIISLSLIFTFLTCVCLTLSWSSLFLANIISLMEPTKEHITLIFQISQQIVDIILGIIKNIEIYFTLIYILCFSMFFNTFVPSKYQMIDIPIKKRLIRFSLKLGYISGIIGFISVINFINKGNYWIAGAISALVGGIPLFLKVIDPKGHLKSYLSDDSIKILALFPLFAVYLFVAWNISANIFDTYMPGKFYLLCFIFILLTSITMFLKIGIEKYYNNPKNKADDQ